MPNIILLPENLSVKSQYKFTLLYVKYNKASRIWTNLSDLQYHLKRLNKIQYGYREKEIENFLRETHVERMNNFLFNISATNTFHINVY